MEKPVATSTLVTSEKTIITDMEWAGGKNNDWRVLYGNPNLQICGDIGRTKDRLP